MTQSADADDSNSRCWLNIVHVQCIKDSSTSTHQRRGLFISQLIRERKKEGLFLDRVCREGSLIQVCEAVHGSLRAEGLTARKTPVAGTAAIMLISPADAVAFLQVAHRRANSFSHTTAFVAEDHVLCSVMLIGARVRRLLRGEELGRL